MGRVLVSVVFWLYTALLLPLEFVAGVLVLALTAPFDPHRSVLHRFICAWTFTYLRLNPFWRFEFVGREQLPRGPAVLVANHQSMSDILICMGLRHPFKFVSKAELFRLPIVGWMMTLLEYVPVERGRPRSAQRMMERCRGWLRRGMSVLIYPEGTYSEGELLPFRSGAFRLAIEEKVPLVPVVIEGSDRLMKGDGPFLEPSCRVRVRVMAPIPPEELGTDEEALAEKMRAQFAEWLQMPLRMLRSPPRSSRA